MVMKPSLADRLRAVVGGAAAVPRVHPDAGGPDRPAAGSSLTAPDGEALPALVAAPDGAAQDARRLRAARAAGALGGTVETRADGYCIVVERHYAADQRHGRHRVGDIVTMLRAAEDGLADLRRAWPARGGAEPGPGPAPDVDGLGVVDLETTGLAGGAGTQAFLVGCARVHGDGLVVRQYLSPGFEFERTQLALVAEWLCERSHLVTFNGRTFDLPLLEMRFSFNRLVWPCGALPHLDALNPARRFWRERSELTGPDPDESSCSLGVLERRLGGVHRVGDVPGFEIPARFFQFARDGRAEPLEAVLEHNRLDLVSTLLVCARAATLVIGGPSAAEHGYECLGLGRLYERLGDTAGAETCYARAAADARASGEGGLRAEALRRLAVSQRRGGRAADAAASWQALLATRGAPARLRREAREALAIHHEHRARDLDAARTLVLEALSEPLEGRRLHETERRLARLDRKLRRPSPGRLIAGLEDESV